MKRLIFVVAFALLVTACDEVQKNETEMAKNDNSLITKEKNYPSIKVLDTDFSKGRLGLEHQINLTDLEKFHGHLCDGLVVGFLGIKEGLDILYPNGIIDRTNTRIVSKSSPCLTDVAVYVSGGRYQFNSFYVDNTMENGFYIVQRMDTKKTVKVNLKLGVIPEKIIKMGDKAISKELSACALDSLKTMEDDFSKKLLTSNPKELFTVTEIKDFVWNPVSKSDYLKTDIINKNSKPCNK